MNDFKKATDMYLKSALCAVKAMGDMVCLSDLKTENQFKLIREIIKFEMATSEFISSFSVEELSELNVMIAKKGFIVINMSLIKYLEKKQLQGYNCEELISALKLENDTLKKEVHLL